MAILGQIQRRTSVLIGIIALALFAFVIQGLLKNSSQIGRGSRNVIAEIDGRKMATEDFQKRVALLQKNNPRLSSMDAVKSVWDQIVKEGILNNEFDKLGINVGGERLRELIIENPSIKQSFTNEQGVFDEDALLKYIENIESNKGVSKEAYESWKAFERGLIESEKEKIYLDMVKVAMKPTLKEGEWYYHFENDAVDFKYAAVAYRTIPDSTVNVSKEEINAYVQKHQDQYKVEEGRDIKYVFIPLEASQEDIEQTKKDLTKLKSDFEKAEDGESFAQLKSDVKQRAGFFAKNKLIKQYADDIIKLNAGEVFGPYEFNKQVYLTKVLETKILPDSAKAAHILIAFKGSRSASPDITRTKEEAKKRADSILNIVKRNSQKFADYAKELSDGPSKTKGGDLGWFTYGAMVPKFNNFVFEGTKGKMGIVETMFGYHVININDLTAPEKLVKTASIIRNIEPSSKTENEIYAKAAQFAADAIDSKDFDTLAKEKGLVAKPVLKVGRFEDNITGIGRNRDIVRWAYKNQRQIGDIAKFDIEKGHVIVKLTGKRDKGLMSAEEASALVKPILLKKKKAAIIIKKMTGENLTEISKNANAKIGVATGVSLKTAMIAGFGKEPKVVGYAFGLAPESISKPIEGNIGVYVIKTLKVSVAADVKNYAPYVEKLKKEREAGISKQIVEALKKKTEIDDKRDLIYQ
jgi:peptidylprolyl isomerase/peptidyl-prolyl cis-trans isomerase D